MKVTEKEKIDQSVYNDFISELEMLNKRIFNLERKRQNSTSRNVNKDNKTPRQPTSFRAESARINELSSTRDQYKNHK